MPITEQDRTISDSSEVIPALAKGTSVSLFGEIGHVIILYVYGIVIARFVGASNFGIFFLGITIFNLIVLFSTCGIEDGLMRFLGIYVQNKEMHKAMGVIRFSIILAVSLGILCGFLCFYFSDLIAGKIFHKPNLATVLRFLSVGVPILSFVTASLASIRGFKIIGPYIFVRKIFLPLISLIFAIVVLIMGYELKGLSAAYILALSCSAVLSTYLILSFIMKFKEDKKSNPELFKYLSFVFSAFLLNILLYLSNWSDLIILGIFWPSQNLGIYFASKKTALVLGFLLISLNTIFAPLISHLYSAHRYKELNHSYKMSAQWILIVSLPIFLTIVFFSNEILSLFGPAFRKGSLCLIVLASGYLFNASLGSGAYLLIMTGRQKWMLFNSIIFATFAIVLTMTLVPRYGMYGAAYANGISVVLASLVGLLETYFLLKIHPYNIRYFKILLAGGITAVIIFVMRCYFINSVSIIFTVFQIFLVFIIFLLLVFLFCLEEDEKKFLKSMNEKFEDSFLGRLLAAKNDN